MMRKQAVVLIISFLMLASVDFSYADKTAPASKEKDLPRITAVNVDGYYPVIAKDRDPWLSEGKEKHPKKGDLRPFIGKVTVQGTVGKTQPQGLWLGCSILLDSGAVVDRSPRLVQGHFQVEFDLEVYTRFGVGNPPRIDNVEIRLWRNKKICPKGQKCRFCVAMGYHMDSLESCSTVEWDHAKKEITIQVQGETDKKLPINFQPF